MCILLRSGLFCVGLRWQHSRSTFSKMRTGTESDSHGTYGRQVGLSRRGWWCRWAASTSRWRNGQICHPSSMILSCAHGITVGRYWIPYARWITGPSCGCATFVSREIRYDLLTVYYCLSFIHESSSPNPGPKSDHLSRYLRHQLYFIMMVWTLGAQALNWYDQWNRVFWRED